MVLGLAMSLCQLTQPLHSYTLHGGTRLVVPAPGLRVDGLAHGAQHAQAAAVVRLDVALARRHQRPDQRGRRVELLDLRKA